MSSDNVLDLHRSLAEKETRLQGMKLDLEKLTREVEAKETEIITSNYILEEVKHQNTQLQAKLSEAEESAKLAQQKAKKLQQLNQEDIEHSTSDDLHNANEESYPSLLASAAFMGFVQQKCAVKSATAADEDNAADDSDPGDSLLDVVSDSVPKIVPNVILAKRDELIPLMLATIRVRQSVSRD